ncbi:hypothetical protein ELBR111191_15740 [Elizabethkingia bruuniana]
MKDYICKVYGFNNYSCRFWKHTMPEYIICSCCCCEAGNGDYTVESIKEYKKSGLMDH